MEFTAKDRMKRHMRKAHPKKALRKEWTGGL